MSPERMIAEFTRLDEVLRLCRETRRCASRRNSGQLQFKLKSIEMRISGLQQRLLESALVELLWRYLDFRLKPDTGSQVRRLLVLIGTKD
ncbi:hypothetical protein CH330_09955 [candidate division WOR-3 bacterium JGI_Cruoil_03_51_56]|uniref:Uncharacterized protein n=1 Tax=candidate division WOR-3 bacterium JGI_Cruoil_03_51_56 TaxID=1973747 RepID=A0A235BP98_UNCW3|nr:MAG: hypothetical protein CH330_09955 [candidate division WOR-3 bacterium JGI_Cruoil_03_51_56]